MNRSLKLSMLLALALGSSHAMALDLGQVQVKSSLGEPLLAEIPLHPANPAELQNLTVQLASSEDFARAGIVGGRTTIPLHFSVAKTAGGQSVIRITSSVAVDDPYLDLLLQVNGKAGTSVREFAILLDPPGSHSTASAAPAAAAPAPAAAAASRPVHRTPAPAAPRPSRATAAAPTPAPAVPTRSAVPGAGQYGPVQHGQTLSSIAHATAPAGVDISQMLVALKQANPHAFYRDNINALKTGAILRVPTASEAQALAVVAAIAEVRRQNSDWRAGPVGKPATVADAATRGSTSSSPGSVAAAPGDRLALLPAKAGNSSASGGGATGGKGDSSVAAVRQDLLRTRESLASLQQQSSDLKTRLKDMADINSKNEHLLSLKDSEIAGLQAKLAAARKAAAAPAAAPAATPAATPATAASTPKAVVASKTAAPASSVAATASASAATPSAAAAAPVASATSVAASPAPAVAATARPAAVEPAPKPVAQSMPVAEQPWYMQPWAWAAGAGAVLVLLLLAMLGRRRKLAPLSKAPSSLADRFGGPAASTGMGSDDIDQDELLDQLAEHPDNIDLHLELVTLYYSRRDVERFEAAAEAMHAHITDPQQDEWQDVLHMGEDLVPGHPLFDHHVPLPPQEESEAHHAFDIDDYATSRDTPTVVSPLPPLPAPLPKKVSEYHFDFDLTDTAPHAVDPDRTVVAPLVPPAPVPAPAPAPVQAPVATEPSWRFGETGSETGGAEPGQDLGEFNDDPVDTKLDLARAYLDMGDADGARAMLGEVLKEGSQMQQDTAKRLLDTLH